MRKRQEPTPLEKAQTELAAWFRKQEAAVYGSADWDFADRQIDQWLVRWRDLQSLAPLGGS